SIVRRSLSTNKTIGFQNKSIPRLKRYGQISPGRHISTVARYIPSYRPALVCVSPSTPAPLLFSLLSSLFSLSSSLFSLSSPLLSPFSSPLLFSLLSSPLSLISAAHT